MHVNRLEKIWLWLGAATMVAFFMTLLTLSVRAVIITPRDGATIDPTKVWQTPPFDHPGLRQTGPLTYEAYYVGQVFSWQPQSVTVPVGSTVTFFVTSADVVHGFTIPDEDVNVEVLPGWVSSETHTFRRPGDYLILCNQYCGIGHHTMGAHVIVR